MDNLRCQPLGLVGRIVHFQFCPEHFTRGDVANVGRGGGYTKGLGHWVGNSVWKE